MIKINSKVNKPTKSRWYQRVVHRITAWMLFMVDVYIPKEFDDMSLWERQRQAKGIPIVRFYNYDRMTKKYERNWAKECDYVKMQQANTNVHRINAQQWVME